MSKDVLFWVLMTLFLVGTIWISWPVTAASYVFICNNLCIFILLSLVGWRLFGPPIK